MDMRIRHSGSGPPREVGDAVEASQQYDCEDEDVRCGERDACPDCNPPSSFEEVFHRAAEEEED